MISIDYFNEHIEATVRSSDDLILSMDEWLIHMDNPTFFNVINDLIVNGTAVLSDHRVIINYEDISQLDEFEYSTLNLPEIYPFDIFIDIIGSGLKDVNLKLRYSFQDFAHGNGSGNILFSINELKGAHLKSDSEYLLNSPQYLLISKIKQANSTEFTNSNEILKAISGVQSLATKANAVLSKVLLDTIILAPESLKIKIEEIGKDRFRLTPLVEGDDSSQLQKKFGIHSQVKKEYSFRQDGKKVRVVIDDVENENRNSLQTELLKLKEKNTFSSEEINEIYNSPTKFWDTDLFDLEEFGERVLELGIYKPKFYPFISPYKSQWIPGISIENRKDGNQLIPIQDKIELDEIRNLFHECKANGKDYIIFKGEKLDITGIPAILEIAEKQLKSPNKPITNSEKEKEKAESQTKVLIIKENTELAEYSETQGVIDDIEYIFHKIDNLSSEIRLKDHQRDGIAWLQTLSKPPFSSSGVLLADDMGLGKTLQVLYFIEWYIQFVSTKPILVVAPVSLLENWQNEYVKFFPTASFTTATLWGSNVKNYIIPNNKENTIRNLNQKAVFLTTYETLRRQQIPLGLIDWGVIILDEAQKIKTPGTFVTNAAKALKSDFKIAMTGTPVENTLMDLWCIIDFCSPGLLANARSFSSQYQKPLKKENTDYTALAESLRQKIGGALMRRMKVDVAKDLPTIEYIKYEEVMPDDQFNIYLNEVAEIERLKSDAKSKNAVLQGIFNLRSISDHPYLKHFKLEHIETDDLIKVSAKLKKTVTVLDDIKNLNEKAILFTENKSMQRVLRRVLGERYEINPTIINGETPTSKSKNDKTKLSRQQEIDKYQLKDGFNVIIMSPISAGFGLNITEANHIIHYTRHWNPAKEQQATDRAYRIGQKKTVKVYYPLAVSPPDHDIKTFDIVLDQLLRRKSDLATSTLFPTEQIEIKRDDFLNSMGTNISETVPTVLSSIESLDKLKSLQFEAAVAVLLEKINGGKSWLTSISKDKGVDIILFNTGDNLLVQVKQSIRKLDKTSGQEIKYALPEYNKKYTQTFIPQVITNSYFSKPAIDLAEKNNIELLDRDTLKRWISKKPICIDEIDNKLKERI